MNNKINPWEGVNLIPFLNDRDLKRAISYTRCNDSLTEEEIERNQFRPAHIFSYQPSYRSNRRVFKSPLNCMLFPNIIDLCEVQVFEFPEPQDCQENVVRREYLPGTARLHLEDHQVSVMICNVVNTGRVSKQETVCIHVGDE